MDQYTETLVKLISERVRTSRRLLANFYGEVAEAEQLIARSKVAIAESLKVLAKPLDGD
jgi:hypothetical protein